MTEDVYEPLERFEREFEKKFDALAREKFEELTSASGVDVAANRALAGQIHTLEKERRRRKSRKRLLGWCIALLAMAAAAATAIACGAADSFLGEDLRNKCATNALPIACGAAAAAAGALLIFFAPYRRLAKAIENLDRTLAEQIKTAWEQMAPLNNAYTWGIPVGLIEKTVPRLAFDPYFTEERLENLRNFCGWNDSFNDGKSIEVAQSGAINGNPFILAQYIEQIWGEKTYTGSKTISWIETVRDADGKRRTVRRHQTLTASVTKPVPEYPHRKILVYGNDASPHLSFSHKPSGLKAKGGFFNKIKMSWRLRRLKKFSHNLDDESNFTLMGNHEFETWFHAMDRNNEVEFRMLFTPIAQIQMLKLMKDEKTGFGDDFSFIKKKKINIIEPRHLGGAAIDTDPARFRHWEWDAAKVNFLDFNKAYFKNVYFAFAPILALPLYQQTRTHEDIWREMIAGRPSCFWEHESAANAHGEKYFRHKDCITQNILKTSLLRRETDSSVIAVTANGFRGDKRIEHKSVRGGDGNWHDVPVEWIEYLPVSNTRTMRLTETATPSERFVSDARLHERKIAVSRSVASFVEG